MFHHNRNRRSRTTRPASEAQADRGAHSSDDEYDDEVFYREQSQTEGNNDDDGNQGQHLFGGLVRYSSQSQTQQPHRSQSPSAQSASTNTTTSSEAGTGAAASTAAAHSVVLMPRHERRRRAREMEERMNEYYHQGGSMSSSSQNSQAESAAPENAFASLELLLNRQQQQQQEKQPEESSIVAPPPAEPQVDLLPSEDAHPAPDNEPPDVVEKPAAVDKQGNTSLNTSYIPPPTLPLPVVGPTTATAGFTSDPHEPLVPEAAAAHTATDNNATIPTDVSTGETDFPNDSGAHDYDDAGQARNETNLSGMPEERNLVTSQQTVHTSQVTTQTNTKRSRGRDQYKYNVPTPSYSSFSPGRNSSNTSSSSSGTRRLATNSQLDQQSNSLLEQTRRIAMKQAKSTAAAAAAAASTRTERGMDTTNSSSAQQRASQQIRKPVPIVNSKSIVGSRPKHWGGSTIRKLGSTGRTVLVPARKRSNLAAELSKAAQTRTLMPPPPRTTTFKRARTEERSTFPPRAPGGASTEALPQPSMDTSTLSFTPAFLSSRLPKPVSEEDQVDGNDPFPDSTLLLSPRLGSPTGMYSPPSRKTGKNSKNSKQAGPLARRLKVIRDAVKGDSVRFQCGQYPFSAKAAFDMNDPRNRAKSYMDVTIMGDSCPWAKDSSQRLTVLAFIHTHEPTTTTQAQPAAAVDAALDCKKCMAWLCFSFETAREQNLRIGSELRIYNAVAIPVANKSDVKDPVDFIVLCTQLCEPYPAVLPKLPEVASITAMVDQNIEG